MATTNISLEPEVAEAAQVDSLQNPEEVRMRAQRERRARCHLDELRRRTYEVGFETQALLAHQATESGRKLSDSHLVVPAKDMSHRHERKLSKSRGVNLPIIPLQELAPSHPLDVADSRKQQHERAHSPPLTSSPISYALRHAEGLLLSQDSQRSVASESFHVLPDRSGDDVIDIRIFYSDGRAVEFTVEGGTEALAEDLLYLMAEHLHIDNETASEALALWLISPLLEVQLKPHHMAFEVHEKWPALLERFTTASEAEIALDEPLLVLRRNVQLTVHRELALEDNEPLMEVLYLDAREEFLTSRYLVDKEKAIELAALQLVIDFGAFTDKETALDLIRDNMAAIIPEQHLSAVRSFRLFGLPMMECKKGLENELADLYQTASRQHPTVHQRRCAYLNVLRRTPFYGATFFRGTTDRRSTVSLKQLGRRLFSNGSSQMEVLVGINQDYITIIDPQRHEPLLMQHITDCTWQRSDRVQGKEDEVPSFFLHFADESSLPSSYRDRSSSSPIPESHSVKPVTTEKRASQPESMMLVSRLLQISSKQAVMMEALLNALYELSVSENGSVEDLAEHALSLSSEAAAVSPLHGENSEEKDTITPSTSPHHEATTGSEHSNASSQSNSNGTTTRARAIFIPKSPSIGSGGQSPASDDSRLEFPNKLQRLCFATFDPAGRCVEAHGTLRRVLMECR